MNRSYKYNGKIAHTGISTPNSHISEPVTLLKKFSFMVLLGDDQDKGLEPISEEHPLQPGPKHHDEWRAPLQDETEGKA